MLAPLKIGQRMFIPKAAQMKRTGWATVVEELKCSRRTYVLKYEDGTRETLTDSE